MKSNTFLNNKLYIFFFLTYFLVGIFIVQDFGISVDEEFHRFSGFYWLSYILEFTHFNDLKMEVSTKLNNISGSTLPNPKNYPFYGVTFDLPLALLETVFQINESKNYYLLRHYANFLIFFVSAIFFLLILINRFKEKNLIILGILLYISSPRIFGDSFYNNKDIIFLSFLTINIYFFFKTIDELNFKNIIYFSIFSALTCATRIIGIFIPLSFILFFFVSKRKNRKSISNSWKYILFYIFLFFLFLVILWPYLWANPLKNLFYSLKIFSSYPVEFKMFFNGEFINSKYLPLSYLPVWILITVPIVTLILSFFGYFKLIFRSFNRLKDIDKESYFDDFWRGKNEKKDFLISLSFSLIFFYVILSNTDLYNGWRHLYFLHIFIIYFGCVGLYRIRLYFKRKNYYFLIFLILISFNFIDILKFHPYQSSYFNQLIQGKKKSHFEVDYWGLAGVKFLKEILKKKDIEESIKIGVASYLPLERSLKMFDVESSKKIIIVGQDYKNADYIFNNNISEVNKNVNQKYNIPNNFKLIKEFFVNGFMIYQIYQRN